MECLTIQNSNLSRVYIHNLKNAKEFFRAVFANILSHSASNNKCALLEFHCLIEDTVTKIAKNSCNITCFNLINLFYEGLLFVRDIDYPT